MKSVAQENRILRSMIHAKNGEVAHLKAEVLQAKRKLSEQTGQVELLKQQHERNEQTLINEISEQKESLSVLETTKELAVNTLHKKQKSFERRKKHCNAIQASFSASQSQVVKLRKEKVALNHQVLENATMRDLTANDNAALRQQVLDLQKTISGMKAEEEQKGKEDEEKRKLLLSKLRQWKEYKMKEVVDLNNQVKVVRRRLGTTSLADGQAKKELQEKLDTAQKELMNAKQELGTCKLLLEQQQQVSAKKFAEQNDVINKKDLEIGKLRLENEALKKWVGDAKNEMTISQAKIASLLEAAPVIQEENAVENNVAEGNDLVDGVVDDEIQNVDDDIEIIFEAP